MLAVSNFVFAFNDVQSFYNEKYEQLSAHHSCNGMMAIDVPAGNDSRWWDSGQ